MPSFLDIAKRQANSESHSDVMYNYNTNTYQAVDHTRNPSRESDNETIRKLEKEIAELLERNRHLEAKIARLYNENKENNIEFSVLQMRMCEFEQNRVNYQKKLEKIQYDLYLAIQVHESDLGTINKQNQEIHRLNTIVNQLHKDNIEYTKLLHYFFKENTTGMNEMHSEVLQKLNNLKSDSFIAEKRGDYNVSPTIGEHKPNYTQTNNEKNNQNYHAPFGFTQYEDDVYLKTLSYRNGEDTSGRVIKLEEQVRILTSNMTQMQESIEKILKILGNRGPDAPPSCLVS